MVTPLTLSSGKHDLTIDPPWMNAAGFLGFSDEGRRLVDHDRLGAFVTHPVSLGPRSPAAGPRLVKFPGGFLLHTGLPGPGLSAVLRRHRRRWAALPCPVILHLLALDLEEVRRTADLAGGVDEIAGIELGLGEARAAEAAALVRAAQASTRPILAHLPLESSRDAALAAHAPLSLGRRGACSVRRTAASFAAGSTGRRFCPSRYGPWNSSLVSGDAR